MEFLTLFGFKKSRGLNPEELAHGVYDDEFIEEYGEYDESYTPEQIQSFLHNNNFPSDMVAIPLMEV